jgi:NADH dehydrogenase/NADH:ubiquinone oxidoreductase subunit G
MGALTSKSYAFQYRAWELNVLTFVDTFDFCFPEVTGYFKGKELIRILPNTLSMFK